MKDIPKEATGRLLQAAFARHQKGHLADARQLYAQILAGDADNFDALQLSGLCCLQMGELATALSFLDRALVRRQDVASVFNHRGVVLRRLGRAQRAVEDFSRVVTLNPRSAEAHYNRANALRDLGRLPEALEDYRRASGLEPGQPAFLNNLGACLKELKRHEEALQCYDRIIAIDARIADAHTHRGVILQELGRLEDALAAADRAIHLAPGSADALLLRGGVLTAMKRHDEAQACLERALALAPGEAEGWNLMGNLHMARQDHALALNCYDRATGLNPDHAEAHGNRGVALRELGRPDEAARSFARALELKPRAVAARTGLAKLALEQGRFSEAQSRFHEVLEDDPGNVECLAGLAETRSFKAGDPLFTRLSARLADPGLDGDARSLLHHALGKISNDAGLYDQAMAEFASSKVQTGQRFNLLSHVACYEALEKLFTSQFFADREGFGLTDERPVFVVGMPRSGTTLTEQILASHGKVQGLGELQDLPRLSRRIGGGLDNPGGFASALAVLAPEESRRLAAIYLEAYAGTDAGTLRVVDKRPHNYELLGLIALLFPRARIIHCRRNAVDNCLSMYMQFFSEGHGYNRDLATLGHYYRAYEDLMSHWRAVLPLEIHDCTYEELVDDVEATARTLIAFLGLEWDPNCLQFHQQERQVRTPSMWQVRQPVYRSSVERWRRYEQHLGPLNAALGIG